MTPEQARAKWPPISRRDALTDLRVLLDSEAHDTESAHQAADAVLLRLLDDPEIAVAFDAIEKWYS